MILDTFSIAGIVALVLVVVALFLICKIRGCNKPHC